MFCTQCGKEVKKHSAFCEHCGAQVGNAEILEGESRENMLSFYGKLILGKVRELINKDKKRACVFAGIFVIIAGIIVVIANRPIRINYNDYAEIVFNGYDNYGTAEVKIDEERFLADYAEKIRIPKRRLEEEIKKEGITWNTITEEQREMIETPAKLFYKLAVECSELEKDSALTNGDEILCSWNIDEMYGEELEVLEDAFNVKLVYEDKSYVVNGLESVPMFDPFEGLDIMFSGYSPVGTAAIIDYPDNGLEYTLNKVSGLSNGDEVEVTVSFNYGYDMDTYIKYMKKAPTEMSKVYSVSGLPEYATSASQIPDSIMEEVQAQARDVITATTRGWLEGYSLDINYLGNLFLHAKNPELKTKNMLVVMYKLHYENTFTDYYGSEVPVSVDYYFFVNWDDFRIGADGTCEYDPYTYWKSDDYFSVTTNVVKDRYGSVQKLGFYGEETLQNIYDMYVTARIENYKIEENLVQ